MSVFGFMKAFGFNKEPDSLRSWEISSNIKECCEKKISVAVTIDEHAIEPMSMFLEMNPKKKYIVIDSLTPDVGNKYITKSEKLTISYHLNNLGYSFDSTFIDKITKEGFPAIKVSYPENIKTGQKRKYFRVEPSLDEPVNASIRFDEDSEVASQYELRDISEGGFSFVAEEDFVLTLKKGMVFQEVRFDLPGHGAIKTKGVVRGQFKIMGERYACGIEFIDMKEADMNKIYRYVVSRQREELSKLKA